MQTIRKEITNQVLLCDSGGRLNPEACGWSSAPLHVCNLKGRFPRKKKWDYWCIMGPRFLFSATVANVDYAGLGDIYFLEYDTRRLAEQIAFRPFSKAPFMPETVGDSIHFKHRGLDLSFEQTDTGLAMRVRSQRFEGKPLAADIQIERPETHETLNVVVPWNPRTFQFTSKQQCLPASGTIAWGEESLTFDKDTAYACLDYGRGIWPYRTAWNWGTFSGRSGADVVGINMGAKWTDGTGMNENGIVLNGKVHKVFEDIVFEYDEADFMKPWHIRTASSDMVDLTLVPFYEKAAKANLVILRARTHQLFGRYSGTLNVDGRTIRIDNILGWAEEHIARW